MKTVAGIAAVAAAQLADWTTWLFMTLRYGLTTELNPVVHALTFLGGVPATIIAKAFLVSLVAVAIVAQRPTSRARIGRALIGTLAGAIGALSNTLVIYS